MINDEELGLKIAETAEESMWERVKRNCLNDIKTLEEELILKKEILNLAEENLKCM
jgi:hypothetical protein